MWHPHLLHIRHRRPAVRVLSGQVRPSDAGQGDGRDRRTVVRE